MVLDPRFICSSDLESVFLDKDTGLPLSAGVVKFYIHGTNVPKEVYMLQQTPSEAFVNIGFTNTLNSIGGYEYQNNPIALYYLPYDAEGNLELYDCVVESSGGVAQFTRYSWPPLASNLAPLVIDNNEERNYIPNGQFYSRNDHPITDTTTETGISILEIAQGGWSFKKTTAGTSTYFITFNDESEGNSGLNDFPSASVNIRCSNFNADTPVRDLVVQWPNVSTFESLDANGDQQNSFNFLFAARVTSGTQQFTISMLFNYGAGGSPDVESSLGTVTVTAAYTYINVSIPANLIPSTEGKTVGAGNFCAIRIRCPANTFEGRFTDFAITFGTEKLQSFPLSTPAEMLTNSIAGWVPQPNPDGSDLYLPPLLTNKGMIWDHSVIGKIVANVSLTDFTGSVSNVTNELICDGNTYIRSEYSPLGIPYNRLGDFLYNASNTALPLFGTGYQFLTPFPLTTPSNYLYLIINSFGGAPFVAPADFNTTIVFSTVHAQSAFGYDQKAYQASPTVLQSYDISIGAVTAAAAGTSGLTVVMGHNDASISPNFSVTDGLGAPGRPAAGSYFTFNSTSTAYYVWFQIDGVGADPAVAGRTGILINLTSSMITNDVMTCITGTLNGGGIYGMTTPAGSAIPASSYWTFTSINGIKYYVWYQKNASADPAVANATGIKVTITDATTNTQVANLTRDALATAAFGTPDYRGLFLRGYDPTRRWDYDALGRMEMGGNVARSGNNLGTWEIPLNESHSHVLNLSENLPAGSRLSNTSAAPNSTTTTQLSGGSESRPINTNVSWAIKY